MEVFIVDAIRYLFIPHDGRLIVLLVLLQMPVVLLFYTVVIVVVTLLLRLLFVTLRFTPPMTH